MAVTKRLRFEIFRRDNHTCRYCGGTAPDVVLTVDHVVAVALGGSDDPSNLVTACKDCNNGKSATPAGAPLVDDVAQDALRWAAAMQRSVERRLAELALEEEFLGEFLTAWNDWRDTTTKETCELPGDWERTVSHWRGLGVPMELLRDAIRRAMTKRGLTGWQPEFRYMAGVVWGSLKEMQEAASEELIAADEGDDDGAAEQAAFSTGWDRGFDSGYAKCERDNRYALSIYDIHSAVSDGRMLAEMGL